MSVGEKKGHLLYTFYITHIKTDNTENVSNILEEHHQYLVNSQTHVISEKGGEDTFCLVSRQGVIVYVHT